MISILIATKTDSIFTARPCMCLVSGHSNPNDCRLGNGLARETMHHSCKLSSGPDSCLTRGTLGTITEIQACLSIRDSLEINMNYELFNANCNF